MSRNWKTMSLDQVASLQMGETITKKELTGDGIPVYSANTEKEAWGYTSNSDNRYPRGTLLLGARGSIGYPRLPTNDWFVGTQTTIVVSPDRDEVRPNFLLHALHSVDFDKLTSTQAVPMLTISKASEIELQIPPLSDQRRIADVLDTVDAAIQETDAVVQKQEQVKTGLLQDLLTRGLDANGRLRDPGREPGAFQESEVGKIPTDWSVKPLQSVVEAPIVYGILKPGKGVTGGVPVIKVKDIKKGHVQDDDLLLTDPEIHEKYKRAELREGDLLFTIRGTVGRMAVVPPHLDGSNITQDTARIRVGDANPRYIRYYLGTSAPQAYFKMHTIGQAVTGINLGQLRQTPIAVPSREEQDRIVNVLDEQFSRIDEERTYREKLQSLKTGLMQDLLTGRVRVPEAEAHVDEVVA